MKKGWTLREAEERSKAYSKQGVSDTYIHQLESGMRVSIRSNVLMTLAAMYGVNASDMLELTANPGFVSKAGR
jgi:hypothetical protein